jgi:carotenoid cleavage dioxygenase-like enzyme
MGRNSVNIDVPGIAAGKSMLDNMKINYAKQNLEFWIMNIADGTYKTYKTDHGGFCMHAGNTYVDKNGNLIFDSEMFVDGEDSPFSVAHLEYLRNADREALHMGSVLRRYTINLESGDVTYEDILKQEADVVGWITINPTFQGKEHQFTYIVALETSKKSNTLLKIDHRNGNKVVASWTEEGVLFSEPKFIDDPSNRFEEGGRLVFSAYDHKKGKNRLIMIDPKSMHAVSDTEIPTRLPQTLH